MTREQVLDTARGLITSDRAAQYGSAQANFSRAAAICKAQGIDITGPQVCMVMVAMKLARESQHHKCDNLVDICGYLALYEECDELHADG